MAHPRKAVAPPATLQLGPPAQTAQSPAATLRHSRTASSSRRLSLIRCFISCHTFNLFLLLLLLASGVRAASKLATRSNKTSGSSTASGVGAGTAATSAAAAAASGTPIWDHAIDLNDDFRILWQIINQDITFEIQARTLGYVGFGFSPDGNLADADMAIGWVDKGQTYFQVSEAQNKNPAQRKFLRVGFGLNTRRWGLLRWAPNDFSFPAERFHFSNACGRKLRAVQAGRPTKWKVVALISSNLFSQCLVPRANILRCLCVDKYVVWKVHKKNILPLNLDCN